MKYFDVGDRGLVTGEGSWRVRDGATGLVTTGALRVGHDGRQGQHDTGPTAAPYWGSDGAKQNQQTRLATGYETLRTF